MKTNDTLSIMHRSNVLKILTASRSISHFTPNPFVLDLPRNFATGLSQPQVQSYNRLEARMRVLHLL